MPLSAEQGYLADNEIYEGDARALMAGLRPESVALSVWSPPYFVGKSYERDLSFESWQQLLREVIEAHTAALTPGGFLAINIADILCFPDERIPRVQADVVSTKRSPVTREMVLSCRLSV